VHFASLQFNPPGIFKIMNSIGNELITTLHCSSGCTVERAHLLSSVIHNIQQKDHYYKEAPLTFLAFEGDKLLKRYHEYVSQHEEH
jgi:hypothetical protein